MVRDPFIVARILVLGDDHDRGLGQLLGAISRRDIPIGREREGRRSAEGVDRRAAAVERDEIGTPSLGPERREQWRERRRLFLDAGGYVAGLASEAQTQKPAAVGLIGHVGPKG